MKDSRKIKILILILFLVEISSLFLTVKSFSNREVLKENVEDNKVNKKQFSMFIETENGYVEYTNSNMFPVDYPINMEQSKCIDTKGNVIDGILSSNGLNVTVTSNKTSYCYLYFDIDKSFAIYSETDNSLRFYNNEDYKTISSQNVYNNLEVTKTYTNIDSSTYNILYDANGVSTAATTPWNDIASSIKKVVVEEEISPISTVGWFYKFVNASSFDVSKLNTSRVTDMQRMFQSIGSNLTNVTVTGLEGWNTSNVTNMSNMFISAALNAETFNIDVSNWDVSKVTAMANMFASAGKIATSWDVGDLSNWNTESLINMSSMFANITKATDFDLGNLNTKVVTVNNKTYTAWDVSNVTNMSGLFVNGGAAATNWNIGEISNWDTSNVTDMTQLFYNSTMSQIGEKHNLGDLSTKVVTVNNKTYTAWDVSNVTSMIYMFTNFGNNITNLELNLDNWNLAKVKSIEYMFNEFGRYSDTVKLIVDNWNTKNVESMYMSFGGFGRDARIAEVNLSKWDTSNTKNMQQAFNSCGYSTTEYIKLGDLSTKVVEKDDGTTYIAWNTSNVTNLQGAFRYMCYECGSFDFGDIANWNTSKVTNMYETFRGMGYRANYTLDLSTKNVTLSNGNTYKAWDASKVIDHTAFNTSVTTKVTPPTWPS